MGNKTSADNASDSAPPGRSRADTVTRGAPTPLTTVAPQTARVAPPADPPPASDPPRPADRSPPISASPARPPEPPKAAPPGGDAAAAATSADNKAGGTKVYLRSFCAPKYVDPMAVPGCRPETTVAELRVIVQRQLAGKSGQQMTLFLEGHGCLTKDDETLQNLGLFADTNKVVIYTTPTAAATGSPIKSPATGAKPCSSYVKGHAGLYQCPGGCRVGQVWGTGPIYTADSHICTAARHLGVIPPTGGGTFRVSVRPGQPAYAGNERNGVTTIAWPRVYDLSIEITAS